ncbi:histidinol-phosphate phosphatase family domain-containing protein/HAD-superfamily hydrolase, subfamily IIIA [Gracilibacillus orientalis]|uniref:Histidinol-phosphate phosphatase family domain-containing protein/HAD-superfamily hydrolase, subfamily IIIA n=1 Tax=Gracilibacillus orientalis TaxID=334253 RepID=A0A1I4IXJ7_9BACI|nr:histidinol-phosphate phosphatase family domain-containing protein/HAD-superfamily hydrolase, subfamily IIIA [Gracilibacillus orientalis]
MIYPGEFELFPNVSKSIHQLKESGALICSFTNQPGISMGEVTFDSFDKELRDFGFDKIYLCPHQHHEGCECRKPASGMLKKAANDNNLDLKKCVVIGDRWTDLIAADEVGCMKILVQTGSGKETYYKYINNQFFGRWGEIRPDFISKNFNEAVNLLMSPT